MEKWLPPGVCPLIPDPAPLPLYWGDWGRPQGRVGGLCPPFLSHQPHYLANAYPPCQCVRQMFVWKLEKNEWMDGWMERRIKKTNLNSFKLSRKHYTCATANSFSIMPNTKGICRDYSGSSLNADTISEEAYTGFLQEPPSSSGETIPDVTHLLRCSIIRII